MNTTITIPQNRHTKPLSEMAKKYNISLSSAKKLAKQYGISKTRMEYELDALERRRIVFNLRTKGLKFREIAELLDISVNNAQQLARRFQPERLA